MDTSTQEHEIDELFDMARRIACKYARRYNRDDCISVALSATIVALPTVPNDADKIAWIASAIHNKVRRFVMFDTLIRNKSRKRENFVVVVSIDNNDQISKKTDSFVRDLIEDAIEDDIDRSIVNYRIQNYDDHEIGGMIGKSRAYIQKRRSDMRLRYDRLYARS